MTRWMLIPWFWQAVVHSLKVSSARPDKDYTRSKWTQSPLQYGITSWSFYTQDAFSYQCHRCFLCIIWWRSCKSRLWRVCARATYKVRWLERQRMYSQWTFLRHIYWDLVSHHYLHHILGYNTFWTSQLTDISIVCKTHNNFVNILRALDMVQVIFFWSSQIICAEIHKISQRNCKFKVSWLIWWQFIFYICLFLIIK